MSTALSSRPIRVPLTKLHPWQRSSFSGGEDNCVELARGRTGGLLLRESDAPLHVVTTSAPRLAALLGGVKAGRFDGLGPAAG